MKAEQIVTSRRIGDWDFNPATGEVRRGEKVRRLEPRAARALEMLCKADGAVVSQEALIANVWNGRTLSENTVPVVIGQLRRALGDDAREPTLIQTIPKRGYRLVPGQHPASATQRRNRLLMILAVAVLVFAGIAAILMRPSHPAIAVSDVRNETGDTRFDPLARATSELIVDRLTRHGFSVRRAAKGDLRLSSKLVIWDGEPFVGLTATDKAGAVVWSAMLPAGAGQVPGGVEKAVDELNARVARSQSRP